MDNYDINCIVTDSIIEIKIIKDYQICSNFRINYDNIAFINNAKEVLTNLINKTPFSKKQLTPTNYVNFDGRIFTFIFLQSSLSIHLILNNNLEKAFNYIIKIISLLHKINE